MVEIKVAQISQVARGAGTVVDVEGNAIAVLHVGGTFFAIANVCTHIGGLLGESTIDGRIVTCPWHGSQFDVTSGHVTRGPARRPGTAYPVRVRGDDVFVVLEETPS